MKASGEADDDRGDHKGDDLPSSRINAHRFGCEDVLGDRLKLPSQIAAVETVSKEDNERRVDIKENVKSLVRVNHADDREGRRRDIPNAVCTARDRHGDPEDPEHDLGETEGGEDEEYSLKPQDDHTQDDGEKASHRSRSKKPCPERDLHLHDEVNGCVGSYSEKGIVREADVSCSSQNPPGQGHGNAQEDDIGDVQKERVPDEKGNESPQDPGHQSDRRCL